LCLGFFFGILIIFTPSVFSFAEESNISTITKNGLILTIKTDKTEFYQDEIINIFWIIENTGNEPHTYLKRDYCDDGFDFQINGSGMENYQRLYPGFVLLISDDDPLVEKINYSLYGHILDLIEQGETREYDLIFYNTDADLLEDALKENHGVTKFSKGSYLSFITASVPVQEIPEVASYNFVGQIDDGEQIACPELIKMEELLAGESLEGEFPWSQRIKTKQSDFVPVTNGDYSVTIQFEPLREPIEANLNFKILKGNFPEPSNEITVKIEDKFITTLDPDVGFDDDISTKISIPNWIRNDAGTWSTGTEGNDKFVNGLKFLIEEEIISVSENVFTDEKIPLKVPDWLKNNARWWANGLISDSEYVFAMQYLIERQIISL